MYKYLKILGKDSQANKAQVRFGCVLPKPKYGKVEVHRTKFKNGIKMAATKVNQETRLAAVTIMYQAGSRMETGRALGATHFIRAATCASGAGYSGYMRMRYLQEHGGMILCNADRQSIAFTLCCPPPLYKIFKGIFIDVACRCQFRQHELSGRIRKMVLKDLHHVRPDQLAMDLVQKAVWAGPLGNSVYCPAGRVQGMSEAALLEYAGEAFTTDRCSVASIGIPCEETCKLVEEIEGDVSDKCAEEQPLCPRGAVETRDLGAGAETWIAVGVPSCGITCLPEVFAYALLAAAMGQGNVMTGSHHYNCLRQISPANTHRADVCTLYKAFNICYRETGTFGFLVRTKADKADCAGHFLMNFLEYLTLLQPDHVSMAKCRLKVELAKHAEDCVKQCEGLALEIAFGHAMDNVGAAFAVIDAISDDMVLSAARALATKKNQIGYAVVGDTAQIPEFGIVLQK